MERIKLPIGKTWRGLNDPEVLLQCVPGLELLEETRPGHFEAALRVQVPAIQGIFSGHVDFLEKQEPEKLTLSLNAKSPIGFVDGEAQLELHDHGPLTEIRYTAELQVGGHVARLGQRMISGITKEMAGQFFEALQRNVAGDAVSPASPRPSPVRAFFQLIWRTLLNLLGVSRRS